MGYGATQCRRSLRNVVSAARQRLYRDRKRRRAPLVVFEPEPEWIDLLVDARVMSREDAKDKVARGNAFKVAIRRLLVGRLSGGKRTRYWNIPASARPGTRAMTSCSSV